jgi:pilus assembly protein CpaE
MTRHATGVHILPSPNYMDAQFGVTHDVLQQLLGQMRQIFDTIVVDGGQTISDTSLNLAGASDHVYLVSILSLPCILNVDKILKFFADTGAVKENQVEILVNRHLRRSDIEVAEAEKIINKKISWFIPNDYKSTVAAINQGRILNEIKPRSPVNRKLREITAALDGR